MSTNPRNEYIKEWRRKQRRMAGELSMDERKRLRSCYKHYKLKTISKDEFINSIDLLIKNNAPG
jgi:hypothetical protein